MLLLPPSDWIVKKTKLKGRGIFARTEIEPGTVIGDYLGKIINDRQLARMGGLYAYFRSDKESIWPDATKIGIHLINHSCMPNCAVHPYGGHMLYYTLRRIFPGEELTASYFLACPERKDESKHEPHICRCGTPMCRATMYATDDFLERFTDLFFSGEQGRQHFKPIVPFGKELPPLDRYPKRFKDHALYDLFGSLEARALSVDGTELPRAAQARKLIRESGRQLVVKSLKVRILGVQNGRMVIER
jgi:uncharacterized protein